MTALRFAWLALRREGQSGELAVLAYSIFIAVAALATVGFFTDRIDRAIRDQAAEILAADLRIRSPGALASTYAAEARRRSLAVAHTIAFPSVVFHGESSSLVSLYAVSEGYPLRGRMRVAAAPFAPASTTSELPGHGEAWAESRLMTVLGARVGDEVALGAAKFRITRVLDHRPDQGSTFVDLAAGMLIRIEDLPSTRLLQEGSRSTHALLLAGRRQDLDGWRRWATPRLAADRGEHFVTIDRQSPQLDQAVQRAERFLRLSSLIAILLAKCVELSKELVRHTHVLRHGDGGAQRSHSCGHDACVAMRVHNARQIHLERCKQRKVVLVRDEFAELFPAPEIANHVIGICALRNVLERRHVALGEASGGRCQVCGWVALAVVGQVGHASRAPDGDPVDLVLGEPVRAELRDVAHEDPVPAAERDQRGRARGVRRAKHFDGAAQPDVGRRVAPQGVEIAPFGRGEDRSLPRVRLQ